MLYLGNDNLVGFHMNLIGKDWKNYCDCKVFIGGYCVSNCEWEYLSMIRRNLNSELNKYKQTLNYLKHENELLIFDDLTEIHNAFVHSEDEVIDQIQWDCKFLSWQMPLTDVYRSYLIPFRGELWMTWQVIDSEYNYSKLDVVNGKKVYPYELIDNFRKCIQTLEKALEKIQ